MPWIALSRNGNLATHCIQPIWIWFHVAHFEITEFLHSVQFKVCFSVEFYSLKYGFCFVLHRICFLAEFRTDWNLLSVLFCLVCNLVSIEFCQIWNFVSHWIFPSLNFVSHWFLPTLQLFFFLNSSRFKFGFPLHSAQFEIWFPVAFCPVLNLLSCWILFSLEFDSPLNSAKLGI